LSETKSGASLAADPGFRCRSIRVTCQLEPLIDLNMRLGEASGATNGVIDSPRRARLPHRHGTLRRSGVSDKPADESAEPKAAG